MTKKRGIPFIKMHGIGNDYIYIDALRGETPRYLEEGLLPDLTRKISDRHFGVGSDGLILILPSDIADFRMRIFNSDGSEAKMCGNGIRCVGKYVYDLGFTEKTDLIIETESGLRYLKMHKGESGIEMVTVDMGTPAFKRKEIPASGEAESIMIDELLEIHGKEFKVNGVSMGNPHGVIFIDNVENFPIEIYGPQLEHHSVWPDRANIEFIEKINDSELKMRVWERGSGETMACGTGACAAAVMSHIKGLTNDDVTVHLRGGNLKIKYDRSRNRVYMTGNANFITAGEFFGN